MRNIEVQTNVFPSNAIITFHEIVAGEPDFESTGRLEFQSNMFEYEEEQDELRFSNFIYELGRCDNLEELNRALQKEVEEATELI